MTTISKDKQYRTRDGNEVRIYTVDHPEPANVIGAVMIKGNWLLCKWFADGTTSLSVKQDLDLIEVKPPIKFNGWALLYREPDGRLIIGYPHATKAEAYRGARFFQTPVACIPININCAEGEGL